MKKLFLFFLSIIVTTLVFAQTSFKKNDLYLEAGGNGLFGSVNYERQLTTQPGVGVRIGLGFYSEDAFYLTIPAGINYLFNLKNNRSFLDAGLGVTWARFNGKIFNSDFYSRANSFVNFVPGIGYRRHTKKDVMYRISISPVANQNSVTPWLGISLGKRF